MYVCEGIFQTQTHSNIDLLCAWLKNGGTVITTSRIGCSEKKEREHRTSMKGKV